LPLRVRYRRRVSSPALFRQHRRKPWPETCAMPETTPDAVLAAGLQRAWADHRADVEEAIAAAARLRTGFTRPGDPAAEPLPAHRAPEIPAQRAGASTR
jgi:hypothetical protein